jgi:hypothetical protein
MPVKSKKPTILSADPEVPELEIYEPDFYVDKFLIEPVHEVRDRRLLHRLCTDMAKNGWTGRPLLVETVRGGWQAWTGSHRTWAARRVRRIEEIPIVLIDKRAYVRVHGRPVRSYLSDTCDDEDRLGRFLEAGDDKAALLMARECHIADGDRLLRRQPRRAADPEVVGIRALREK